MNQVIEVVSLSELPVAAEKLLAICEGKKVFAFKGEMGAGKTTFIKAICEQLNVIGNISSPTFSLVNEYLTQSGEKIFHFDFYRIKSESEAYDMGYEDYLYSNSYCFIEWPEKIENLLPSNTVLVAISKVGEKRELIVDF